MLGTLSQTFEYPDINYVYLPLDDGFFNHGACTFFKNMSPKWEDKSDKLFWRGSCSGAGGNVSLRARFVKILYNYEGAENVRLSSRWSEGKDIDEKYFAERVDYREFLKYKIHFIIDGNSIASSHMWGFCTKSIPFLISNGICWFSPYIKPYVHYVPVEYDLSNLIEQVEWVKNNDDKAKIIAENAYQFAETFFSSKCQKICIKTRIDEITIESDVLCE